MIVFEALSPTEFVRRREMDEVWQLVDVRETWEVELARVAGTIHIPMAEIELRQGELDDARPVAVLCHSGGRSAVVAEYLKARGFETVANITGGIDAWSLEVDGSIPRY